jgi:hypothetical protein
VVADPATEVFIRQLRPDALDLHVFYDNGKKRIDTYIQMAEAILYQVRAGYHVLAIFYGHPGVFVHPSHRALQIARKEGYYAVMRPAVSAEDCLFADLGVDPCYPGLQSMEATDMLLRHRPILTDSHVILWQVGVIGKVDYRRKGLINDKFHVLVDYLEQFYGGDHVVTHYIAAQYTVWQKDG